MENQDKWYLENAVAEKYEEMFVPALFAAWADKIVDAAGLSREKNILDVACGTGIVARTVKDRLKNKATVTGLDLNPAMLNVAKRVCPDVNWIEGNAEELPFENEYFDAIFCQAGLMFFPEKIIALSEMNRVLCNGGKMVVQVWAENEAYNKLIEVLEEVAGSETASILRAPFVLNDITTLANIFERSGIAVTSLQTDQTILKAPSLERWLQVELESWALSGKVDGNALLPEVKKRLGSYCNSEGMVEIPMKGHIVLAVKN